jgi:hypothetical protein
LAGDGSVCPTVIPDAIATGATTGEAVNQLLRAHFEAEKSDVLRAGRNVMRNTSGKRRLACAWSPSNDD